MPGCTDVAGCHGRHVVVTRTRAQAGELVDRLEAAGAVPVLVPTIRIAEPADWRSLDAALANLAQFSGAIFTSTNGVNGFFARAAAIGVQAVPRSGAWICALGPATAAALSAHPGWQASVTPARPQAEGVVAALAGLPLEGREVLLARAAEGRDVIPEALQGLGARVRIAVTHRTVLAEESADAARAALPGADAVILTSPSTARHLALLLGEDFRQRLQAAALIAIGPVTAAALRELGLTSVDVAPETTPAGLVQAVCNALSPRA